jgi:N-acetyl-gamma-glutamyl-phosphate reductase
MMNNNDAIAVGVAGASGYGGAELLRLLAAHPTFQVTVMAGGATAGQRLDEVFPHLQSETVLADSTAGSFTGCTYVFLATPHELSLELAPALVSAGATVIDLSGAFRLDAAAFEQWYGITHTAPHLAPAAYGLPELFGDSLPGSTLVANPGCYPTAALLALGGLAGLVEPDSVVVAGLSGTSGAGKGLKSELHFSHASNNVAAYGAPAHRHTPEIERGWAALTGTPAPLTFVPHLVPMPRGLLCTVTAALGPDVEAEQIHESVAKTYAGQPFVRIQTEGSWPSTTHLRGSNGAALGVAVDPRTNRVTASCAIDNLGKGAAGQAIQNANILAGLPPDAGLSAIGVYP